MRLIIAGSRTLESKYLVQGGIDLFNIPCDEFDIVARTITEVVSGGAKGIDESGEDWAYWNGEIPITKFKANWNKYGKSAGYKRNKEMAEYGDELLAIWDGESKGTLHMIDIMKAMNKPVHILTVNIGDS